MPGDVPRVAMATRLIDAGRQSRIGPGLLGLAKAAYVSEFRHNHHRGVKSHAVQDQQGFHLGIVGAWASKPAATLRRT